MIFVLSLLCSWIYARYNTRPIVRLSKISEQMASLDFSGQCSMEREDELDVYKRQALPGMRQGLSPGWPDTVLLSRLCQDCSATAKEELHEKKAELMCGKLGPGNAHISRLSGAAIGVGNIFSLAAPILGKCFPHFAPELRDILSQSPVAF